MFDPTQQQPYSPIPGTLPSPRGLFIDRWGTLFEQPEEGFVRRPEDLVVHPETLRRLFRVSQNGWNIYLLGNEEPVWDGRLSLAEWNAVEAGMLELLQGHGIRLTRFYKCLVHPEGVAGQCGDSVYMLPNTGAFYHARHEDGIVLPKSWVIGDSTLELVAGWRAGLRQAGVRTGAGLSDGTYHVDPAFVGEDLCEVLSTLCELEDAVSS